MQLRSEDVSNQQLTWLVCSLAYCYKWACEEVFQKLKAESKLNWEYHWFRLLRMDRRIDPDAPIDYVELQIFPSHNRFSSSQLTYRAFICQILSLCNRFLIAWSRTLIVWCLMLSHNVCFCQYPTY